MNATVACPSESHRRSTIAHGRICVVCEPEEQWPASCPMCRDTVTAVGTTLLPHELDEGMPCPGSGERVEPPPVEHPRQPRVVARWTQPPPKTTTRHRTLALVPEGAA